MTLFKQSQLQISESHCLWAYNEHIHQNSDYCIQQKFSSKKPYQIIVSLNLDHNYFFYKNNESFEYPNIKEVNYNIK